MWSPSCRTRLPRAIAGNIFDNAEINELRSFFMMRNGYASALICDHAATANPSRLMNFAERVANYRSKVLPDLSCSSFYYIRANRVNPLRYCTTLHLKLIPPPLQYKFHASDVQISICARYPLISSREDTRGLTRVADAANACTMAR